jgi:hypothetical protein
VQSLPFESFIFNPEVECMKYLVGIFVVFSYVVLLFLILLFMYFLSLKDI